MIPLLKTLWLNKKDNKRIRLQMKPRHDRSGVDFEIVTEPVVGGNAGQRRAHDLEVGSGTMSGSGARCQLEGGAHHRAPARAGHHVPVERFVRDARA